MPADLKFYKVCGVNNFVSFGNEKFFVLNRIGTNFSSVIHNWLLSLMEDISKRFAYFIDDAVDYRNDSLPWKFMEKATVIFVPTEAMKDYLIDKDNSISHKVTVVSSHINLSLLSSVSPLAKIDGRIQLLWGAGGLTGLPLMEKIVRHLDQKWKDVRLFCAGSKIGLVRAALEPVKNIDIRYFEFLTYQDFVSICKASQIHLNPLCADRANILVKDLQDPEIFFKVKAPIKFMHAGEAEKVLVTTPIPSYGEVIVNGENGFLAKDDEWLDILDYLLENVDILDEIGQKARKTVEERFDTRHLADQYLRVYLGGEYEEIMGSGVS